jgi:DNA replication and repair protein RecF
LRLESIRIANFRNHKILEYEPGPEINVIYGRNGSGKTSILEAIHYCAFTRGFSGSTDAECLAFGEENFSIKGVFGGSNVCGNVVRIAYTPEKEKKVFVNEQEITSFSRHIGAIPCVTFAPHELAIVNGAPSDRRRFLDSAICQYDSRYMADLIQYRRILQQRNALLAGFSDQQSSIDGLEIWTSQLALYAASIVTARLRFVQKFREMLEPVFTSISEGSDPDLDYHCTLGRVRQDNSQEDITLYFIERYKENRKQEILRRQTLAGPHRDDLRFFMEGHEIRKYASQGQQRSYLVAMKITQHRYLTEMSGEQPITLLDDLFSELDDKVSASILDAVSSCGQVLITSTQEKTGNGILSFLLE